MIKPLANVLNTPLGIISASDIYAAEIYAPGLERRMLRAMPLGKNVVGNYPVGIYAASRKMMENGTFLRILNT